MAVVVRDVLRPEHDPVAPRGRSRRPERRLSRRTRPGRRAQLISTASNVGGGEAHPDVDLVAHRGHGGAGREEQHRGLHVRRLGEQPLLAADGVRRPHEAGGVEPAAGDRAPPGPQRGLAGRGLQADAVGGAAGDDQDRARARGACGRGSRRRRRARPGGRPARWPRTASAPRSPSHSAVPIRGRKVKSGYAERSVSSSALGEVRDPDRAGRPRLEPGGHDVGHQPLDLAEVGAPWPAGRCSATPSTSTPPPARTSRRGLAQPARGEAVARIEVIRSSTTRGRLARVAALLGEGLEVLEPADGVDHPRVVGRPGVEGPPRRQHEQRPVEALASTSGSSA